MSRDNRTQIEETLIEAPLSEKELETLLVGFLEALEKEQRLELGISAPTPEKKKPKGETA